jgi:hypothetical protein
MKLRRFFTAYAELDRQIEKFRELQQSYVAANASTIHPCCPADTGRVKKETTHCTLKR